MSERWLYIPDLHLGSLALPESEARHALQSLRCKPGDELTVFDGQGRIGRAELGPERAGAAPTTPAAGGSRRGQRTAIIRVQAIDEVARPRHSLTLIVAACKGARLDWLIEKCTELGVERLLLAEFERSVVHVGPQLVARLRRIAIEACKQCRRAWLPHIEAGMTLGRAVTNAAGATLLIAHPAEGATPLGTWLRQNAAPPAALAVVIGPEGGLSPGEVELLCTAQGQLVRLTEHVLRVETAAVAAAAALAAWQIGRR